MHTYVVYLLLLESKRFYVGMTKTWRLQRRFEEHCDLTCWTTRWTTKYKVRTKLRVFPQMSFVRAKKFEHFLTEELMKKYGLDSTRGGGWNMASEGPTVRWWVPLHLQNSSCFTPLWFSLSSHKFGRCADCAQALDSALRSFQATLHSSDHSFLKHALISPKTISLKCS